MVKKNKITKINVDYDYFKKYFEPQRIKYSKKYGVSLSQVKFTKILLKESMGKNKPIRRKRR